MVGRAANITIGILALQGAFREHKIALERCGVEAVLVKKANQVDGVQGLVIPGGESTTIGKLMDAYGFFEPIRKRAQEGMPIFGTCAGMILLAKEAVDSDQPLLDLVSITIKRNAFGRQVDSFEADLKIDGFDEKPFHAIFIRAPKIEETGSKVRVLAKFENKPVLVEQGQFLACSFHPELTGDTRVHQYFIDKVRMNREAVYV